MGPKGVEPLSIALEATILPLYYGPLNLLEKSRFLMFSYHNLSISAISSSEIEHPLNFNA
jgi:hypothetical protein